MGRLRSVDDAAWPHVLSDLERLGASRGEVLRVTEALDMGMPEVAFSLVDAILKRMREES